MTMTALITGATSGIGRAAADKLAQSGVHVMVVGRNVERGEKTIEGTCNGRYPTQDHSVTGLSRSGAVLRGNRDQSSLDCSGGEHWSEFASDLGCRMPSLLHSSGSCSQ